MANPYATHTGSIGTMEISGAVHPAVQSALAAVAGTPQFAHLVAQHAAAMGVPGPGLTPPHRAHFLHSPPWGQGDQSTGGPGAAYGGGGVSVQERPLRDIREFSLGFLQTAIATATNSNVVSRPQVVFRGERLVVPTSPSGGGSGIASSFNIVDIKVGNRSQLVSATALPAQAFIESAVGVRLSLDTASIAQDITIIVNNILTVSATFQAILFGTAAQ